MPVAFEDKMKRKVQNAAAGMWAESRVLLLRPQEGACVSLQHSVRRRESRPRAKSLDVCVCVRRHLTCRTRASVGRLVDLLAAHGCREGNDPEEASQDRGEMSRREGRFRRNRVCLSSGITGKKKDNA